MILPNTKHPLIDFAEQSGVSDSLIIQFIEAGGMDFFLNAWVAYATTELKDRGLLSGMTPVEGLDLGRKIFEDLAVEYQKQFKEMSKE